MPATMSTSSAIHRIYSFGEFTLDLDRGALLKAGTYIKLRPKSFEVLSYLVEHHERLVSKDELLDAIWGRTVVCEDAVNQCVTDIRKALCDQSQEMLRTVPRRGYIFDHPVTRQDGAVAASDKPSRAKIVMLLVFVAVMIFAYDKWWTSGPLEQSIAVLPFKNMSGDPEQEYFSDGVSEELLNKLAQVPELRVISRSSAFYFKGKNIAAPEIARQLNVAHVLEGSVRRMGNRVRVTAQLIEASTDTHLWSNTYDRDLENIFVVQDEIAAAITDALKLRLVSNSGETVQPKSTRAANTDAYDAYLMALDLKRRGPYLRAQEAIRFLKLSLRLDDNFAPAHAQLALSILRSQEGFGVHGTLRREEVLRRAIPHLDRAAELEPNLEAVHVARGWIALDTSDKESAIEHAQKALAVNPNSVAAMNLMAHGLQYLSRYKEALEIKERILATDPLSISGRSNYIFWLCEMGKIDEARKMAKQILEQDLWTGYRRLAVVALEYEGKIAEAVSWLLKARAEDPENTTSNGLLVDTLIALGEYEEARRIDDRLSTVIDVAEGRFDAAIRATQTKMQLDPENQSVIRTAADTLYMAGRIDQALPLYEHLRELSPEGFLVAMSWTTTMRLAIARRDKGDENGAQAIAEIARYDISEYRRAIGKSFGTFRGDAVLAAFDNDSIGLITALKAAMQVGFMSPQFLADPMFEDWWGDDRFSSLQQELYELLAKEHNEYLQLVCFNNPVPGDWRPLPETCEGVVRQQAL